MTIFFFVFFLVFNYDMRCLAYTNACFGRIWRQCDTWAPLMLLFETKSFSPEVILEIRSKFALLDFMTTDTFAQLFESWGDGPAALHSEINGDFFVGLHRFETWYSHFLVQKLFLKLLDLFLGHWVTAVHAEEPDHPVDSFALSVGQNFLKYKSIRAQSIYEFCI